MDAFYASVEQRDNPALKGKPVIVGSPPTQRGVVCAASYEARKFGVRSAMPSATAGRLCPKGIFLRPRMEAYRGESREIMAIMQEFAGELIQQVSVDEAYMDVSAPHQAATADESLERALPLAQRIKAAIRARRQLSATIGIAPNKLLAKLASDFQKPDGLTLIRESEKVAFLRAVAGAFVARRGQSDGRESSSRWDSHCRRFAKLCGRLAGLGGFVGAGVKALCLSARMIVRSIWAMRSKASAARTRFSGTPTTGRHCGRV